MGNAAWHAHLAQVFQHPVLRAAQVQHHRQLTRARQPQLGDKQRLLLGGIEFRQVKIQADFAHGIGAFAVQPVGQLFKMRRPMARQIHRVQA